MIAEAGDLRKDESSAGQLVDQPDPDRERVEQELAPGGTLQPGRAFSGRSFPAVLGADTGFGVVGHGGVVVCGEGDSNPYSGSPEADFKSAASTDFAIPADGIAVADGAIMHGSVMACERRGPGPICSAVSRLR